MEQVLISDVSEILIRRGLPVPILPAGQSRSRVAVLAQPGSLSIAQGLVGSLLAEGTRADLHLLPDGEAAKTLQVAGEAYQWLADLGIGRHDTIVGVGGGAVTDFAGFIAATWLRGVAAVYLPTTLLGAVDAAIGGKTGLNLSGKNLVGVFRHPSRVIIDLDELDRLPDHLLREGYAEAIKAGFIADSALIDLFDADNIDLEQVVVRAVRVKAGVVESDFDESGRRGILNYGHTIGHGIEVAAGISHGEAVSIGMIAAGAISEDRFGFSGVARQRRLLDSLGLPVSSPSVDPEEVRHLIGFDKKRDAGGLRMALLEDFGRPRLEYVSNDELSVGLAAIGLA